MASHCDLEISFKQLAARVPYDEDAEFIVSCGSLPIPAGEMKTDRIVIKKRQHSYSTRGDYRCQALHWYAHKETFRYLGLLILAVMFQNKGTSVHLRLKNPHSEIKHLIVSYELETIEDASPGYHPRPYVFSYWPYSAEKHPWLEESPEPWSLPMFGLTNLDECVVTEDDWQQRDTLMGFGSDQGSVRLAELFLNISRPAELRDEFELEGELGFRGVAPGSAEVRLWLPGSFDWREEYWQNG